MDAACISTPARDGLRCERLGHQDQRQQQIRDGKRATCPLSRLELY